MEVSRSNAIKPEKIRAERAIQTLRNYFKDDTRRRKFLDAIKAGSTYDEALTEFVAPIDNRVKAATLRTLLMRDSHKDFGIEVTTASVLASARQAMQSSPNTQTSLRLTNPLSKYIVYDASGTGVDMHSTVKRLVLTELIPYGTSKARTVATYLLEPANESNYQRLAEYWPADAVIARIPAFDGQAIIGRSITEFYKKRARAEKLARMLVPHANAPAQSPTVDDVTIDSEEEAFRSALEEFIRAE